MRSFRMTEDDIAGIYGIRRCFHYRVLQVHGMAPEKSLVMKKGEIEEKDITVEYSDDQYTVVVPVI